MAGDDTIGQLNIYLRRAVEEPLKQARLDTGKLRGSIINEAIENWLKERGFM